MVDVFGRSGAASQGTRGPRGPPGPPGPEGPSILGSDFNVLQLVTVSDGVYKDYMKEINDSYDFGFTPFRTRYIESQSLPWKSAVRCFKEEVYVLDDDIYHSHTITSTVIKDDGNATLTYAIQKKIKNGKTMAIVGPKGPTGVRGPQGKRGEKGEKGNDGSIGKTGDRGPIGPRGPNGYIDYEYTSVAALKYLPGMYRKKILENGEKKSNYSFRVDADYLEFLTSDKIKKWRALEGSIAAVQDDSEYMARYEQDKVSQIQYLKFIHSTYSISIPPTTDCTMFIVYRLKEKRKTSNDYIMIGDNEKTKTVKWKTIGFNGEHTELMITDCNGNMMKIDNFPRTSPLIGNIWHCLCVKWSANDASSIWVNARKISNFTAGKYSGPNEPIILGGQTVFDERGFHGDMALFEVYNTFLKDDEIFMMQNKYCKMFQIKSDDGNFLYPIDASPVLDNLCSWLPNMMLENLRQKEEAGCFLIRDIQKDIKRGKDKQIVEWVSRADKKCNLKGKVPSRELIELPFQRGYALDFNKTYYTLDTGLFMSSYYGFVCITFRTQHEEEQILLTNYDEDESEVFVSDISVTRTRISILGSISTLNKQEVIIQHDCSRWTTLFIEWFFSTEGTVSGRYMINDDKEMIGTFRFSSGESVLEAGFSIGGRGSGISHPFIGGISAIEIHTSDYTQDMARSIKELVIKDQMLNSHGEYVPAMKKKKII